MPTLRDVLRGTNLSNLTVRQSPSTPPVGGSLIVWPDDFTYLGAFKLPQSIDAAWLETLYSQGLVFIDRPADTTEPRHLVSTNFRISPSNLGGMFYEYRVATPTIPEGDPYDAGNYPTCTVMKKWDDVTSGKMLMEYNGDLVEFAGGVDARFGLGYDTVNAVFYFLYGDTYRPADETSPHFIVTTLNYDDETGSSEGPWMVAGQAYKGMLNGMLMAPESYAGTYLSGNRVCLGWGGYGSIVAVADCSMGANLTSIPDPLDTTPLDGVPGAVDVMGYWPYNANPGAGRGREDRYQDILPCDYPLDAWGLDKYTWRDFPRGMVWIDTGTKYGILQITREGTEYNQYVNSALISSSVRHTMSVIDPYACAPQGVNRYDVEPETKSNYQFPTQDYSNTNYAQGTPLSIVSIVSNPAKAKNSNDGCLVTTSAPHGFTDSQQVDIRGADQSEYDAIWALPDSGGAPTATTFYIRNSQQSGLWGGVDGTGTMTVRTLGGYASNEPIGMAFDPVEKKLYIKNPAYAGNPSVWTFVHVYQLND